MGNGSTVNILHVDNDPQFVEITAKFLKREDERFAVSIDRVVRDSVPEGDYVSQAVGLGPTTLWCHSFRVSARETTRNGTRS